MNDSVFCRIAARADLPAILRLYAQPDLDDGKVLPVFDAESIFDRIKRYPNYKLYVAAYQDQTVGTFALLIMDNLAHLGAPSAIIEDVAVDPAFQGRGIGKTMMRYALGLADQQGCYKVMVSSNQKRYRAHSFYEALGFQRQGYSFWVNAALHAAAAADKKQG